MVQLNCLNLNTFLEEFTQLEQKMTEINFNSNTLATMLEDSNRLMKFHLTKEKSLTEERDSLLITVDRLQQTLKEQCNLRGENERLKDDIGKLKQQMERRAEDEEAHIQQLVNEMSAEVKTHKRELETVQQQCRREVEDAHRQSFNQLVIKDCEVKKLLEKKDLGLDEMKKRLKDQERERQSELLKLQMEFGAKLARVQSAAQWKEQQQQQQQQQQSPSLLPQSVFKRKLQFFQEEKNKEIVALRQRIKALEENQRTCSLSDSLLKKRKI